MTHPEAPALDTVTEALAFLAGQGYTDDLTDDLTDPLPDAIVDYSFRFEGPSDPADEAIVLGVRWSGSNRKGVLVSAFGADADPEHTRLLVELAGQ